jgi:hypothetical protein
MRKLPLALTLVFLAPTAVMAMGGRQSVGDAALGNNVILAKGDKTGTGPGHGGHKGQHKGEKKGGQEHGGGQKKDK